MSTIRVFVVNEIKLICNVMAATLEDFEDLEVVGSAITVEAIPEDLREIDVMLVSTSLPEQGALRLIAGLREQDVDVKVLVVGLAESEAEILQYVEAGADGYVLKDESVEELVRHIRALSRGEALVSPEIASRLITRVSELAQMAPSSLDLGASADLTPREHEVLELIGQEMSNQEIATRLVIELGTVKNHVHSILQKLNVTNRQDASAYLAVIERHDRGEENQLRT